MLPTTIDMEDYSGSAKIGYPNRELSGGAPSGTDPSAGNFAALTWIAEVASYPLTGPGVHADDR